MGEYSAPRGATRRVASMREDGHVLKERRAPYLNSSWLTSQASCMVLSVLYFIQIVEMNMILTSNFVVK